jgi:predicted phosphodiesterase
MKIRILSDLHLEFRPLLLSDTEADVVVLAGDIGLGVQGLEWARASMPNQEIVYVAGNHEYYKGVLQDVNAALRTRAAQLGIHFLDRDEVTLKGVLFLGATLWTDYKLFGIAEEFAAMRLCGALISDHRMIGFRDNASGAPGDDAAARGVRRMTPSDARSICEETLSWLRYRLPENGGDAYATTPPFDHGVAHKAGKADKADKVVVVTHHMPSMLSVPRRFRDDRSSAAFASSLEDLVQRCNLWIHGHTHDRFDYTIGASRVVANPRGYPGEEQERRGDRFDDALVIEL